MGIAASLAKGKDGLGSRFIVVVDFEGIEIEIVVWIEENEENREVTSLTSAALKGPGGPDGWPNPRVI